MEHLPQSSTEKLSSAGPQGVGKMVERQVASISNEARKKQSAMATGQGLE